MSKIILTTLGTSEYKWATYQWGERSPKETQVFSAALKSWLPDFTVKVLMTPEAQEKNGAVLQRLIPDSVIVPIFKGSSDAENWAQFGAIVDAVPAGSTVYMDVTHGFRSLPIVTLLALAYLRSVRGVTMAGVLYGAWEPGRPRGEVTPVFDLTPFVSMLDWASAAERFIDTGDARKMTRLLAGQPNLEAVAAPLAQLSGALAFQRPVEASRAAQELRKQARKIRKSDLPLAQGQFSLALKHIEERFEGIAHGQDAHETDPERVLKGQYRQIMFYSRGGQYAQAAELTREWLLSVRLWKAGRSNLWLNKSRTEKAIESLPGTVGKLEWSGYQKLWAAIRPIRNSFAHFNDYSTPADRSTEAEISALLDLIDCLPAAVRPLGLELE